MQLKAVFLSLLLCVLVAFSALAQFEGTIDFTRTKGDKVTKYRYYVQGNAIRIEEYSSSGDVVNIMLVDADESFCVAINTARKMWKDSYSNKERAAGDVEVSKTTETQQVQGYKCTKYVVINNTNGSEVHYWVGGSDFDFFGPTLKVMNRKDKLARYFQALGDTNGAFPIIGEEYDADGNLLMRLEVTAFTPGEVANELFEIPEGYQELED